MKLKTLLLTPLAVFAINAFACDQMAIWDFGPNGTAYTELPASQQLQTQPTLSITAGVKDGNGKDGVQYTDLCGTLHAYGQGAAWDNLSSTAEWVATLDTRGWQGIHVRFDYKRWNFTATSLDVSYSINGGAWVQLANDAALGGSLQVYYPLSFDFSATTAWTINRMFEFVFMT